jgi:hypothetical protein
MLWRLFGFAGHNGNSTGQSFYVIIKAGLYLAEVEYQAENDQDQGHNGAVQQGKS